MRRWTQEERERQAALIRSWKPWERSTGPSTEEGRAAASMNALKHGMRSAQWMAEKRVLNELLLEFKDAVEAWG